MAFAQYIERVLAHEGGYVNHPTDPGGETNWGISKRAYPHLDIRALTREQAIEIYRRDYWERPRIAELPKGVDFQVFDAGVNHGPGTAVRWLQDALGVTADGSIGPVTIGAARRMNAVALGALFNARRLRFFTDLGTFGTFGRGWTRRVVDNLEHLTRDGA